MYPVLMTSWGVEMVTLPTVLKTDWLAMPAPLEIRTGPVATTETFPPWLPPNTPLWMAVKPPVRVSEPPPAFVRFTAVEPPAMEFSVKFPALVTVIVRVVPVPANVVVLAGPKVRSLGPRTDPTVKSVVIVNGLLNVRLPPAANRTVAVALMLTGPVPKAVLLPTP